MTILYSLLPKSVTQSVENSCPIAVEVTQNTDSDNAKIKSRCLIFLLWTSDDAMQVWKTRHVRFSLVIFQNLCDWLQLDAKPAPLLQSMAYTVCFQLNILDLLHLQVPFHNWTQYIANNMHDQSAKSKPCAALTNSIVSQAGD